MNNATTAGSMLLPGLTLRWPASCHSRVTQVAGAEVAIRVLAQQIGRLPEPRLHAHRFVGRTHHQRGEIDDARQVEAEIDVLALDELDRLPAQANHSARAISGELGETR